MKANQTIVAFHLGRGGHYHNPGHLSFIGTHEISHFTEDLFLNYDLSEIMEKLENENEDWDDEDTNYDKNIYLTKRDLFIQLVNEENFDELEKRFGIDQDALGSKEYFDGGGNPVGLTASESETGIGKINIDYDYDTTYTTHLSECSDAELRAIISSNEWNKDDVLSEYAESIGYNQTEIQLMEYFQDWELCLVDFAPTFKEGKRVGYIYEEEFVTHDSDENIEGEYYKIGDKFYTKENETPAN